MHFVELEHMSKCYKILYCLAPQQGLRSNKFFCIYACMYIMFGISMYQQTTILLVNYYLSFVYCNFCVKAYRQTHTKIYSDYRFLIYNLYYCGASSDK